MTRAPNLGHCAHAKRDQPALLALGDSQDPDPRGTATRIANPLVGDGAGTSHAAARSEADAQSVGLDAKLPRPSPHANTKSFGRRGGRSSNVLLIGSATHADLAGGGVEDGDRGAQTGSTAKCGVQLHNAASPTGSDTGTYGGAHIHV